jgi:hypothetical protein
MRPLSPKDILQNVDDAIGCYTRSKKCFTERGKRSDTMRSLVIPTVGFVAILLSATSQAAQSPTTGCDSLVGGWEYVEPSSPGRGIIARTGSEYLLVYVDAPKQPPTSALSASSIENAGAVEFACEGSGGKYRWTKMRWLYELVPPTDGGVERLDMEVEGDNARWWFLDADGKRGAMGAAKRLK